MTLQIRHVAIRQSLDVICLFKLNLYWLLSQAYVIFRTTRKVTGKKKQSKIRTAKGKKVKKKESAQ